MDSTDEEAYMELVFTRDSSVSRQEKVKALWKFLDARDDLQPHKGTLEVKTPSETKSSASSVDEREEEKKDVWRKGLEVFQELGLEKIALTTDNKCKFCLTEKTTQYGLLAV
ncbi:hypothetical protein EAI_09610 [Harpegnathos saltator]|uniref:Uncharacterized protein n=1 Tax=Harpegnathos saltator TaxID=610380 RepID=E2BK33_HARSA|nr:hypothetical protein EAI_09610 [Harpegnathos saltator]